MPPCSGSRCAGCSATSAGPHVKIFPTTHFGYRKITVERPLRLNFLVAPERIERLHINRTFQGIAESRKINRDKRDAQDSEGGIVGYEINFNRYFYVYKPPRPLPEIEVDIRALEKRLSPCCARLRRDES